MYILCMYREGERERESITFFLKKKKTLYVCPRTPLSMLGAGLGSCTGGERRKQRKSDNYNIISLMITNVICKLVNY